MNPLHGDLYCTVKILALTTDVQENVNIYALVNENTYCFTENIFENFDGHTYKWESFRDIFFILKLKSGYKCSHIVGIVGYSLF